MPFITRRSALALGGSFAAAPLLRGFLKVAAAEGETESYGLSVFGDLGLPADFKALPYVRADAPKGGAIVLEPTHGRQQSEFHHLRHAEHLHPEGQWRGRHGRDLRHPDDRHARRARCALRPRGPGRALVGRQADLPVPAAARGAVPRRLEAHRRRRRVLAQHPEEQGPPQHPHQPAPPRCRRGRGRRCRHGAAEPGAQPRTAPDRGRPADLFEGLLHGARIRSDDARAPARLERLQGRRLRTGPLHQLRSGQGLLGQGPAHQCRAGQFRHDPLRIFPRAAGRVRGVQIRRHHLPRGFHLDQLGQGLRFSRRDGRAGQARNHSRPGAAGRAGLVDEHAPAAVQGCRASARRSASLSISSGPTRTSCSAISSGHGPISRTRRWRPPASRARTNWRCSSRSAARFPMRYSARP